MKPLMLPEGWISCLGRILMLGVDSLRRGSSEKPGQEILKTYTSKMRFTTEDGISPVCASASSPSLYVNCRSNATLCKDSQTTSAAVATVQCLVFLPRPPLFPLICSGHHPFLSLPCCFLSVPSGRPIFHVNC